MPHDARKATAIHEAGHAVIGRVLGLVCGDASIEADEDSSGHSICADPYETWQEWEDRGKYRDFNSVLRGRILSYMAGREAEIECLGSCPGGDEDDQYQIAMMMKELMEELGYADDDIDRYEGLLRRKARYLIRRHRKTIQAVARSLLECGCLSADDVDERVKASRFPFARRR